MRCVGNRMAAVVLLMGMLLPLYANADRSAALAVPIAYDAPEVCPSRVSLEERIQRRVALRRELSSRAVDAGSSFDVAVRRDGEQFVATIGSTDGQGGRAIREIRGQACAELVDAAALIVAMAIVPNAGGDEPPHSGSSAAAGPEPRSDDVPTERSGGRSARAAASTSLPAADRDGRAARLHLSASAQSEMMLGYVSTPLVGFGARLRVSASDDPFTGPALIVGVNAGLPAERRLQEGRATLQWTTGELDVCPYAVKWSGAAAFSPCLRCDLGRVRGVGDDIAGAKAADRFWASVGVLGSLAWIPSPPWTLELRTALLIPLTPYRFTFLPDTVISGPTILGISVSVGAGLSFL